MWLRRLSSLSSQSRGTRASTAAATSSATSSAFHTAVKYTRVKSHAPVNDTVSPAASNSGAPSHSDVWLIVHALSQYGSHFDQLRPTMSSSASTPSPVQSAALSRCGVRTGAEAEVCVIAVCPLCACRNGGETVERR